MAISFDKFIEKYTGKSVANPQVGTFKGECVSLVQMYLYECFGEKFKARGNGNTYAGNLIKEGLATKVAVKNIKKGDIISYPAGHSGCDPNYGHVAIYYDKDHVFQQNVNVSGDGVTNNTASLNHGFTAKLDSSCTIARMKKAPVVDKEEKPATKYKFKKGQKVEIVSAGNTQANGKGVANYGIGFERQIMDIYEGEKFPYEVGDGKDVTGYYQESDLKAISSTDLKVGDTVEIIKAGNTQANGKGRVNGGIGYIRQIRKIYKGDYPYEVGTAKAVTGYYKADALKKR